MAYKRILVALDGSEMAERVLPQVEEIAAKFAARLVLVRSTPSLEDMVAQTTSGAVAGGPPDAVLDMTPYVDAEQEEARTYLAGLQQRIAAQGVEAETQVLEGDPGIAIVEYAKETAADLIAQTSHGRGGLQRLVFGSVADRVLRHATCAVLVLPVHDQRGTDHPH